ncbi:unnamed protein product [Paramecium sonneborni]|uniref:Uncharacterized protein n=1 Tax=Paramecium sonneborni TaxID=65129 RepID=A0A8S1RUD2_9CILI|nr:unnamed protein product [Paramecium sonneborni]
MLTRGSLGQDRQSWLPLVLSRIQIKLLQRREQSNMIILIMLKKSTA